MIRARAHRPAFLVAVFPLIAAWSGALPSRADALAPGLHGEYFSFPPEETSFDDFPRNAKKELERIDPQIYFPETDREFPGTPLVEHFFVRWTGFIRIPKDGSYTFSLASDDGSRLYLDEKLVIDNWGPHALTTKAVRLDLKAGDHSLRILYYDLTMTAGIEFRWSPAPGRSDPVPPAILFHDAEQLRKQKEQHAALAALGHLPIADVDLAGGKRHHGRISLTGEKITVHESGGGNAVIDPADVARIGFHNPEWEKDNTVVEEKKPEQRGPLAAPWKHSVVGRLVSGASAHGDGNKIQLFTSAKHPAETFSAFSIAYRPAPKVGHITARVVTIENPAYGSYAGVVYRDGPGVDSRNVILSIRPTGGAHMRHWKTQGGSARSDSRGEIRPPYWLRLIRDGENVTGLISPDGRAWRKLWEVPDKFEENNHLFGLVAGAREGNKPWAATFDNVSVGDLKDSEFAVLSNPRIYLSDGSIIRGPVTSNEIGKLIQLGKPWNRTVPALYVNRIDFFHPTSAEVEDRLAKMRPGVLLAGGDYLEATFNRLQPESLSVTSKLFGEKELRPGTAADSIVLREPASGPRRAAFKVETWDDQIFFARRFAISGGKFVFDSPFLGKPAFPPDQIRRIASPGRIRRSHIPNKAVTIPCAPSRVAD